jgi:hypothetical protein
MYPILPKDSVSVSCGRITFMKKNKKKESGVQIREKVGKFSQQLFGVFLIFITLIWGYAMFQEKKEVATIPLSQFATLVLKQEVVKIDVGGMVATSFFSWNMA